MAYQHLTVTKELRGVASIVLNRPEVHNAFNEQLIAEMTEVIQALGEDGSVRLAVISGAGKSFCAGGDLNWMRAMKDYGPEENLADAARLASMYIALRGFPKPLIGVVHGIAFGGGSGIAAVCDYVLATEDAKFGFTETRLGLLPSTIGPFVIEKIGAAAARAHFISGSPFGAQEALRIGLAHRLVAAVDLERAREDVISNFLLAAPEASEVAKQQIDIIAALMAGTGDPTAPEISEYTVEVIAATRAGEEAQEGMDALLSKRKPKWVI
ncbi:MAG: hypothetical protein EBV03_10150 [Proteobacteria bacterium]|nr:hypothetical protein [Pseudomonadota bacterium]